MTSLSTNQPISIATGPAGRAIAQPMEPSLVDAFQQHLTMERKASAVYFAFAIWFAERDLRGFCNFFHNESLSEQEHAAKIAEYLIARGQTVQIQELNAKF